MRCSISSIVLRIPKTIMAFVIFLAMFLGFCTGTAVIIALSVNRKGNLRRFDIGEPKFDGIFGYQLKKLPKISKSRSEVPMR